MAILSFKWVVIYNLWRPSGKTLVNSRRLSRIKSCTANAFLKKICWHIMCIHSSWSNFEFEIFNNMLVSSPRDLHLASLSMCYKICHISSVFVYSSCHSPSEYCSSRSKCSFRWFHTFHLHMEYWTSNRKVVLLNCYRTFTVCLQIWRAKFLICSYKDITWFSNNKDCVVTRSSSKVIVAVLKE